MEIDYEKIEESAKNYADQHEPRYKKAARQAYTDGMIDELRIIRERLEELWKQE